MQRDRTCRTCGEAKPPADFYANAQLRDGLAPECKTCWKKRAARNKRAAAARRDARRARIQAKLDALGLKVCAHCRWLKLRDEFHVNRSTRDGLHSWCKPCARANVERSVQRHGRKQSVNHKRLAALAHVQARKAEPCADCGRTWPSKVMHFHHLDPTEKVASLATLVSRGRPVAELDAEIAKCELLCANCHIERHMEEG